MKSYEQTVSVAAAAAAAWSGLSENELASLQTFAARKKIGAIMRGERGAIFTCGKAVGNRTPFRDAKTSFFYFCY